MPKEKLFDTEEALVKSMELFWKKGYNGTSINDLVEATGLSRSSLYSTYTDKHQLYLSALKHYQEVSGKSLEEELNKFTSAIKKIEILFRSSLKSLSKDPYGKGCFMINTATEMANQNKELSKIASDDFTAMEELLFNIIKEGQAKGEIGKKHKAKSLAQYFFTSYLGLRVQGQISTDKAKLEEMIKITLSVLN